MKDIKIKNVGNIHDANLVLSLLKEHNLQAYSKGVETGEYLQIYAGNNFYGYDIYVPEYEVEEAKQILRDIDQLDNEVDKEMEEMKKEYEDRKQWYLYVLGILVAIPIIAIILFMLTNGG